MFSICFSAGIETLFNLLPSPLNHNWSYFYDGCSNPIPWETDPESSAPDASPQEKVHRSKIWAFGDKKFCPPHRIQALCTSCIDCSTDKSTSTLLAAYHQLSISETIFVAFWNLNRFDMFNDIWMICFIIPAFSFDEPVVSLQLYDRPSLYVFVSTDRPSIPCTRLPWGTPAREASCQHLQ
jgi:hypothetical protein